MDWTKANCRGLDPDLMFPARGSGPADVAAAKQVCAGCEIQPECLERALAANERRGVWGGSTYSERRAIIRSRRLVSA